MIKVLITLDKSLFPSESFDDHTCLRYRGPGFFEGLVRYLA